MNLPIVILFFVLILLIIAVIEATIIVCRQKRNIAFQQNESDISKEFRDRLDGNLSHSRLNDEKLAEMVKNNAESINSKLSDISSQLKLLSTEFNKQVERINPSYTTERVENFCGQIMNRVISLEEKIYDLKRVCEKISVHTTPSKSSSIDEPLVNHSDITTATTLKGNRNLISDLIKSMNPGENANPAETKKFEMQVKIINMVDEVLKISEIQDPPNFTLTLDTHWVKELGISYEQVARVDVMLLARLFNLGADDILNHLTDTILPKEIKGISIFWDAAWKRSDDYLLWSTKIVGDINNVIYDGDASTIGKDFWKNIPFGDVRQPDYTPSFSRIFYYCTQKDYFNREDKKDTFISIIKNLF